MTNRQRQVLRLMAMGLATKDIAQELGISPNTVETHMERVRYRLQVSGRELYLVAWKIKLEDVLKKQGLGENVVKQILEEI